MRGIKRIIALLILLAFVLVGCESNKGKWVDENNNWYYLSKQDDSKMVGWIKDEGNWYYCNQEGAMQTGWLYDNGNWYYLYSTGQMARDITIGGYYLSDSGAWTTDIPQPQEEKKYKHIPVKITKINQEYYFKGTFKVYIEYQSDEYGLKNSTTIGNGADYAYECFSGQYKVGDNIQAIMYSWQRGDVVTKIELGNLDYN